MTYDELLRLATMGGGTGPVKPGNQVRQFARLLVPNPTGYV